MKKILALILSLVVIATALFSLGGCDIALDDCNHKYDGTTCVHCGVITTDAFKFDFDWRTFSWKIIGIKNGYDLPSDIILPSTYNGIVITSIGDHAFYDCSSLTSVVISDSVISISEYAFAHCSSLTNIVIPDSVTSIGSYAFFGCSSLTSVVIPDNVTYIGSSAFYGCYRLYVIYNNSDLLFEIGSINNGYVSYYAKVLVNNGVTTYENDGYNYTLTNDGFLFRKKNLKYELISYVDGENTVTLPKVINGNPYDLYYMCGVVNVIIPEGFKTINNSAFADCSSLASVVIPDRATLPNLHPQNNYCTL